MTRSAMLTGLALAVLLLASCADAPEVADMTSAPPAEIAPVRAQYLAAWNGKDPQAVAAFFAEDAVVTNEEGQTLNGREDIQQRWLASAVPTMSQLETTAESFEMMGDRITATGRFSSESTAEGETGTLSGRYEQVWQRQPDGEWKIAAFRSWSQQ